MSRSRRRPEDGFAGGAEGLLFGMLVFVVGTLLLGNAWAVVDAKQAADEASRQAARTYVQAADASTAAAEAVSVARQALTGYGRVPGRAVVSFAGATFGRCLRVTVTVTYRVPLVALPLVHAPGSVETVTARHSELVDPYRTGLAGAARCA